MSGTTYHFLANTGSQLTSVDSVLLDDATVTALEDARVGLGINSGQSAMFAIVRIAEAARALAVQTQVDLPALRNVLQLLETAAKHHGTIIEVK